MPSFLGALPPTGPPYIGGAFRRRANGCLRFPLTLRSLVMDVSGIAGIGSTQPSYAGAAPNGFKQSAADFKSLEQALQAGNLAGAQQAFATLQQDSPWVSRAVSGSATGNAGASAGAASPLQALSKALQAGDITAAQQAFSALQQAGKHHGHHHHASNAANGSSASTASASVGSNVDSVA
jgi:hypothetical protein